MANPDGFPVTEGSGSFVAGYTITEGGETRVLQRVVPNTPEGEDVCVGSAFSIDVTVTRPSNVTAYAALDAWSDSTSSPTSGGFLFTGASRGSGKSGLITDLLVFGSAAQGTQLQAELLLFDSAVTNINDNSAFLVSLTDLKKMVARMEFTLEAAGGGISFADVAGVHKAFKTAGAANLYGLVRVLNAYTPVSGESLTFRLKGVRTD